MEHVNRRMCGAAGTVAVFAMILFLVIPTAPVDAQVFPQEEQLDVVRLVDGTVLRGVITERVPDRYVEIQLWGGSTFVLGFDSIESIEQEENPDYGTTWIKVEIDALDRIPSRETEPEAPVFTGPRPMLAGGHSLGIHAIIGESWFTGDDYDDMMDEFPDVMDEDRQFSAEFGLVWTYLQPFSPRLESPWMWGLRGSIGVANRGTSFQADTETDELGIIYQETRATMLRLPLEFLVGVGFDRVAVLAGVGPGFGILLGNVEVEYSDKQGSFSGDAETDTDLSLLWSAGIGVLVRLGDSWLVETRFGGNGQLTSWFDEEFLFNSWGISFGMGYRL